MRGATAGVITATVSSTFDNLNTGATADIGDDEGVDIALNTNATDAINLTITGVAGDDISDFNDIYDKTNQTITAAISANKTQIAGLTTSRFDGDELNITITGDDLVAGDDSSESETELELLNRLASASLVRSLPLSQVLLLNLLP